MFDRYSSWLRTIHYIGRNSKETLAFIFVKPGVCPCCHGHGPVAPNVVSLPQYNIITELYAPVNGELRSLFPE